MRFLWVALLPEVEQHDQQVGVVNNAVAVEVFGEVIARLPECEQHHQQVAVVDDVVVVRIARARLTRTQSAAGSGW
jgi:hypothetical protein